MTRRLGWLSAFPALLLLIPSPLAAQDAANIDQLIERTIAGVSRRKVIEAEYKEIIARGDEAVGPVRDKMLSENDEGVRIAAAMVLAEIAKTSRSDALMKALNQCWEDSSVGVNYWGLRGLLAHKGLTSKQAEDIIIKSLDSKRSFAIRLIGCRASGQRKIAKAVPWLVYLLMINEESLAEAKKTIFVEKIEVKRPVAPKEGAPGELEPPTRGPARRAPRRRAPMAPDPVEDAMPEGTAPEMEVVVEYKPINVRKTRYRTVEKAANKLEVQPLVTEIRYAGVALEEVTRQQFGFSGGPTWDLAKSIVKARAWYEQNRAKYPGGPIPLPKEEGEEEGEEPVRREPGKAAPPAAAPAAPAAPAGRGGRGG